MSIPSPVIILTGASKGLGLKTLSILVNKFNARVVSVSRSVSSDLETLQKSKPEQIKILTGDVSLRSTAQEAVDAALGAWGVLDGLVLNAGSLGPLNRLADVSVDEVQSLMAVNCYSLLHAIQTALPALRNSKGSIIMVSSGAAEADYAGWGPYSASKAYMNSLARTLGNEEKDVFTIAIRPGVVDTDMQLDIRTRGQEHMAPEAYAKFKDLHSSGSLLPAAWPGYALASLACDPKSARTQSGKFVQWDASVLEEHQNPEKEEKM